MQFIFTICLGVGAGYTIISFMLGNLLSIGDFSGDVDTSLSPLRPAPIAAFLTVFGGTGLLFYGDSALIVVLSTAFILGIVTSFVIYRFILIPLHKAQNTSTVEKQSLIGHTATVTEKILKDQYGKITYYVNGNTLSSPAKSEDGNEILVGTNVEIIHIENSTYYVRSKY